MEMDQFMVAAEKNNKLLKSELDAKIDELNITYKDLAAL